MKRGRVARFCYSATRWTLSIYTDLASLDTAGPKVICRGAVVNLIQSRTMKTLANGLTIVPGVVAVFAGLTALLVFSALVKVLPTPDEMEKALSRLRRREPRN
jgi:hypothetical protein